MHRLLGSLTAGLAKALGELHDELHGCIGIVGPAGEVYAGEGEDKIMIQTCEPPRLALVGLVLRSDTHPPLAALVDDLPHR